MRICRIFLASILFHSFSSYGTGYIHVVTEDWPPYNYLNKDGEMVGSSTKVIKQVLEKANIKYDIRLYPWARSYEMALKNNNTMIYSILRTPNREKLFKWVCPISGSVELYLYKLKKRTKLNIDNIEQAKNYSTGVTRNDFPHIRLKQLGFKDEQLLLSPVDKNNIIMLLNEKIDLVIESTETMETILKDTNFTMDDVVPILPLDTQVKNVNCMAFNRQTDDKIVERVRQALSDYSAIEVKLNDVKTTAKRR